MRRALLVFAALYGVLIAWHSWELYRTRFTASLEPPVTGSGAV